MVSYSDPPVKVQFSDSEAGMTPNGGVELWLRAAEQSGAFRDLPAGVSGRQGWTDGQMMLSLCLLNVLGWGAARLAAELAGESPAGAILSLAP